MTPLCNVEGRDLIKFVQSLGYRFIRQKGSHMRFKGNGKAITIHVRGKKVIKPGRLKGLLNEINVEPIKFLQYLNQK